MYLISIFSHLQIDFTIIIWSYFQIVTNYFISVMNYLLFVEIFEK